MYLCVLCVVLCLCYNVLCVACGVCPCFDVLCVLFCCSYCLAIFVLFYFITLFSLILLLMWCFCLVNPPPPTCVVSVVFRSLMLSIYILFCCSIFSLTQHWYSELFWRPVYVLVCVCVCLLVCVFFSDPTSTPFFFVPFIITGRRVFSWTSVN